jgi:sugar/nucleoside kinase (ribokinase family)
VPQRQGFVTAGTWCVDYNKLISAWPAEDTATEVLAVDRQGGGSGHNMALDLKRLDLSLPVETMGVIGEDDDGRFLAPQCDAAGIKREQLQVVAGATTSVDAFSVAGSGRRTHFFHQGAGALLCPDHFDFSRTNARVVHLGLPGAHKTMDAPWRGDANGWAVVLRNARAAGLQTNLELMTIAPDRLNKLAAPCLPHLDTLIVNDFEVGGAAGIETRVAGTTDVASVKRAIQTVFERGAMRLVAVHFPEAAVVATRDGAFVALGSVAIPVREIIGANGAGDAFAAGLLYGLHEGWEIARSLTLAHCAAAASMRAISTTAGVTDWRGCLALGERWGFRAEPE